MFGNNPIRSKESDPSRLAITSIFYTIQGEGPFSGSPALFIRLAGCNLACTFCDTEFEQGIDKPRPVGEIVASITQRFQPQRRRLVVITGGEPLRQDIGLLCEKLLEAGTEMIQIETAGTVWQPSLAPIYESGKLTIVCSPKTPGVHAEVMARCSHWKYIIQAGRVSVEDGLPNYGTQPGNLGKHQRLFRPFGRLGYRLGITDTVWVSPCDDYDTAKNKDNLELVTQIALHHGYRVSLQTHKLLGVE